MTARMAQTFPNLPRIAIVGAGPAGLACAHGLAGVGRVRLFDKGRGPGGRLSTRRVEPWRFDHGAPYLTVRDPAVRDLLGGLEATGTIAPWPGRIVHLARDGLRPATAEPRWVGVPGMSAVVRHLAIAAEQEGTRIDWGVHVAAIVPADPGPANWAEEAAAPKETGLAGGRWRLRTADGTDLGRYDAVAVAIPGPQAVPLLAPAPALAAAAADARMAACWAGLLVLPPGRDPGWDAAFVEDTVPDTVPAGPLAGQDAALSWIARDTSKPGRTATSGEAWVVHAAPDWSDAHVDDSPDVVLPRLLAAFARISGIVDPPLFATAHRWRFARPVVVPPAATESGGNQPGCLWDAAARLGACGDWCRGPRVEAAFQSGLALAARMAATLSTARANRVSEPR